jgi:hypothetical protein
MAEVKKYLARRLRQRPSTSRFNEIRSINKVAAAQPLQEVKSLQIEHTPGVVWG